MLTIKHLCSLQTVTSMTFDTIFGLYLKSWSTLTITASRFPHPNFLLLPSPSHTHTAMFSYPTSDYLYQSLSFSSSDSASKNISNYSLSIWRNNQQQYLGFSSKEGTLYVSQRCSYNVAADTWLNRSLSVNSRKNTGCF